MEWMAAHGPMCSVHHPGTFTIMTDTLHRLLDPVPFDGVVWDEQHRI
jgi:hypothetical protein